MTHSRTVYPYLILWPVGNKGLLYSPVHMYCGSLHIDITPQARLKVFFSHRVSDTQLFHL